MEALIVTVFALLTIVLLEAAYSISMALVRWTPVLAAGSIIGWLAHRHGIEALDAVGVAIMTSLLVRHLLHPRRLGPTAILHNRK